MLLVPAAQSAEDFKPFRPHIIDGGDDPVCQVALDHYIKIYNSPDKDQSDPLDSDEIFRPTLIPENDERMWAQLRKAKIHIDGEDRILVYATWLHRVLFVHGGYLIRPDQMKFLEQKFLGREYRTIEDPEVIEPFFPTIAKKWNWDWSRYESIPFRYKGEWYLEEENGAYSFALPDNSTVKNYYKMDFRGRTTKVCSIQTFERFERETGRREFPFVTAYQQTIENITEQIDPLCNGQMETEDIALEAGKLSVSKAIFQPWSLKKTAQRLARWKANVWKHLSDWKYKDLWSYREAGTLANLKTDAIQELENHYARHFGFAKEEAWKFAEMAVDTIVEAYYAIGNYRNFDVNFDVLAGLVDGTFSSWEELEKLPKVVFQIPPLDPLLLTVDVPQIFLGAPEEVSAENVKTFYDKDLLMFAAHMNNFDAVSYLLAKDWPLNAVTYIDKSRGTGCSGVQTLKRTNRSALTYAAENASIELIKLLVEAGMDTEILDSQGNSLDYYLNLNPRFSAEDKALGFNGLLAKYAEAGQVTPSFPCGGKLSRLESAICSNPGLAIYDRELSRAYGKLRGRDDIGAQMKKSQVDWIGWRTRECRRYKEDFQLNACIARTTRARIRYLDYVSEAFDSM